LASATGSCRRPTLARFGKPGTAWSNRNPSAPARSWPI